MAECCSGGTKLLYACSGAADLGEISDMAARRLRDEGFGSMTCLAAIGADLSGFVQSAKGADVNITIDGCQMACARKNLERIGVSSNSYILTEMGLEKGKTPVTAKIVAEVCEKIKDPMHKPVIQGATVKSGGCGCCGTC